jgi:alpha-amylase/alpha-mannosidase (GH57 family)
MNRLQFVVVLHNHQPVGNDPHIIEEVAQAAYRTLLGSLEAAPWFRHALHVSGPLLAWMESADAPYLERLGRMVERGQVELLTGGLYEPILAAIPSADRIAQVIALSDRIERRFGVRPQGLWLTERVWEPQVVPDLVAAGVRYVFMDDRAFIAAGIARQQLTSHFLTEEGGQRLAVFPLDQRLRTLIPWRPVEEAEAYLRDRAAAGDRVAVFGDDGEKFGAWPETYEKVYTRGWLAAFLAMLQRMGDRVVTCLPGEVLATTPPAGLCYLPTSSYSEMEDWALPPAYAAEIARLRERVGIDAERFAPFIRGSHWKQFFVRYPEANRAHKKMLALRGLLPRRARWRRVWDDLYAAQCNDGYWHGWFGGVYLPLLRHQTWILLARVERALRRGQGIALEQLDLDLDGYPEVWVHSGAFSAQLAPHQGGTLVEWTDLRRRVNVLNVLTRRPEWYHAKLRGTNPPPLVAAAGQPVPDAHEALAYDGWDRASFRDRFLDEPPSAQALAYRAVEEHGDFVEAPYGLALQSSGVVLFREGMVRTPSGARPVHLRKAIQFDARGRIEAVYCLTAGDGDPFERWFAVEMNLFLPGLAEGRGQIRVDRQRLDPGLPGAGSGSTLILREGAAGSREVRLAWSRPAQVAMSPIRTVAQSERGFEMTCQGHGLVIAWPVRLSPGGDWSVQISARIAGKE